MGVFKQFATNRELEKHGAPLKFAANPDGTIPTLFVKRTYRESPAYQAIYTRITKPFKDAIDQQTLAEDDDQRIMQRVCAEASVTGWENWRLPVGVARGMGEGDPLPVPVDPSHPLDTVYGVAVGDKSSVLSANAKLDIPFSFDAVADTFRVLPDVWRLVAMTAIDPDAYKTDELESMAKNW